MSISVKYKGPIVNRRDAIARGEILYFTGKSCKHDHIDQRYVSSYGCLSCTEMHTKKYVSQDPGRWSRMNKSWRDRNPQKVKNLQKSWSSKRKSYDKKWRKKNIENVRASARAWAAKSRATPEGRVAASMRVHIRRCVKEKNFKSFDVVGYAPHDLVEHLERQFVKNMSWENYGDWHIDHIVPIKWFTERGIFCAKEINALSNLRPIWASENLSKKDNRMFLI